MEQVRFSSVIFDFDSTLSAVEGVDYLAELHDVAEEVKELTRNAMNSRSVTPELYEKRLELIQPREEDISQLINRYREALMPGVLETVQALQFLGKQIYIISAGLYPAVLVIGEFLGIPGSDIYAVNVFFDAEGNYTDFDRKSPLVDQGGKRALIEHIEPPQPVAFIGDGANDVSAGEVVDRFIGYGGAEYRPTIESRCEYYLRDGNFAGILPYILRDDELEQVSYQEFYDKIEATI